MTIIKAERVTLRPWTTDEYHRLIDAGILSSADKVELLDGQIVEMSPAGNYHAAFIESLADILRDVLSETYMIRTQNPVTLGPRSEPEPDLAVVNRRKDYYAAGHPGPADISLLIEVADTSLNKDRYVKAPLYAGAGVPEYWIVNLEEEVLEQYLHPERGRYQKQRVYRLEDTLDGPLLPALPIREIWL